MSKQKKLIRKRFREAVFARDRYACRVCGEDENPEEHDAHHITDRNEMPNGGYAPENGITLCPPCHIKAEVWHVSEHLDFVEGYHPDDLYTLIGSSFEEAVLASMRLGK